MSPASSRIQVRKACTLGFLATIADTATLPAGHPASGKSRLDGRPTAYVCKRETCSLPIVDPSGLRAALLQARRA